MKESATECNSLYDGRVGLGDGQGHDKITFSTKGT